MAICSYLVIPRPGAASAAAARLSALPDCDVAAAENREVLLLVTDTPDAGAETALRERIQALEEVQALVLAFGEVDAERPGAR